MESASKGKAKHTAARSELKQQERAADLEVYVGCLSVEPDPHGFQLLLKEHPEQQGRRLGDIGCHDNNTAPAT